MPGGAGPKSSLRDRRELHPQIMRDLLNPFPESAVVIFVSATAFGAALFRLLHEMAADRRNTRVVTVVARTRPRRDSLSLSFYSGQPVRPLFSRYLRRPRFR